MEYPRFAKKVLQREKEDEGEKPVCLLWSRTAWTFDFFGGSASRGDCAGACRWAYNCRLLKKLRNADLLVQTTFVWPGQCCSIYIITAQACCKERKSFYANAYKINRQVIIIILFEIKNICLNDDEVLRAMRWMWLVHNSRVTDSKIKENVGSQTQYFRFSSQYDEYDRAHTFQ